MANEPETGGPNCRRCGECAGSLHHAMDHDAFGDDDAPAEVRDFDTCCKHCDALGKQCQACDGVGIDDDDAFCPMCGGEGVIWSDVLTLPESENDG